MYIEPKLRGFICTTAHPIGCAKNVEEQINYLSKKPLIPWGPKKVLIIGASTGYGLASRIVSAFSAGAQTLGVFFERSGDNRRTSSPGWYNTAAFERAASQTGLYAKSINGDAFSMEVKHKAIEYIQRDWGGGVELVIYSLAAPRRIDPQTGMIFSSSLKPIGQPYTNKTIDILSGHLSEITIEPATEKEIADTVAVMGGEDWVMWIDSLLDEKLLSKNARTIAYSYIGSPLTHAIYTDGTIGQAKKHLYESSKILNQRLQHIAGHAYTVVAKAVVTQASGAIPVVPLYISLLYRIMKEKGLHEGCIEQIYRLYADFLYPAESRFVSEATNGLIRTDDWEMREDVQHAIMELWPKINDTNVNVLSDLAGYTHEFYKLFGFEVEEVDYNQPCDIVVPIPSLDFFS